MSDGYLLGYWGDIALSWIIASIVVATIFVAIRRHGKRFGSKAPQGWEVGDAEPESGTAAIRQGYVGERCPHCLSLRLKREGVNYHCASCDRLYATPNTSLH
jgi:hypothetical protein